MNSAMALGASSGVSGPKEERRGREDRWYSNRLGFCTIC